MNEFWHSDDKEYKYRILVYPNITFQKSLEKDSFVVVLHNVIRVMNQLRDDIHWTILTPYKTPSLQFENTEQRILPMPSYPNSMRTHFNVFDLDSVIDWKNEDFDVVYSHLPEHTLQLKNYFSNRTNIRPKFIGYCHWYEVKENTGYTETMFLANVAGMLKMDTCGVNSEWLKSLVLERASKYYNNSVIKKLNRIIQPHYLGVDTIDIPDDEPTHRKILFNHRNNGYTGWSWFIEEMEKLYDERTDFDVRTTLINPSKEAAQFASRERIDDRIEYLDFLKGIFCGVGCFGKYSAWSISTTDGLSRGVPYILPRGLCYPEMVGSDYPLLYDTKEEFIGHIKNLLDNPELREQIKNDYVRPIAESLLWESTVPKWFNNWEVLDSFDGGKHTNTYDKVKNFIMARGSVTKKQILEMLRWGKTFSFQKYRNLLRDDPDIILTEWGYKRR